MKSKTLLLGLLAAAVAAGLFAAEGMWMPQQVRELAPELAKMGLKVDPARLADLTGDPMGAIVSLGGCSASFVSPRGLIVTNHHCVFTYLQYNSTPQKDLIENGFLAKSTGEEIPAAPDARVWVTTSIEEVTDQVLPKSGEKLSDLDRYTRVERRRKELVRDCEKEGNVRYGTRATSVSCALTSARTVSRPTSRKRTSPIRRSTFSRSRPRTSTRAT